jgi:3'-phosphoadenosine 5'-phosphosulfate sulfotransferase (PAPS reductase)/FAD synthetase
MSKLQKSLQILQSVRDRSAQSKIGLAFSCGKDSLVILDLLKKSKLFDEVVLFYMYFVKDLEHVEKKLDQIRKVYGHKIIQYPHWDLTQFFRNSYARLDTQVGSQFTRNLTLSDIENKFRKDTGIEWVLNGMKSSDSMDRRLEFKKTQYELGAILEKSKRAFPIVEWTNKEVKAYIANTNMPKPISYGNKRVSGLSLEPSNLYFIKENYPADYQKILKVFPFAELNVINYERQLNEVSELHD